MAKKRLRKKQQKKTLQQIAKSILKTDNEQIEKQVDKYSYNTLLTITQEYDKKQRRRQKQKEQRSRLRNRKKKYLESLGINPYELKLKDIDSIKVKDMENKTVTKYTYPKLFNVKPVHDFDFDKVYKLKNGERFYFAFRDFAGETSFEEILADYTHLSNEQLLARLENIVHTPTSYSRGKSASSGKAGDYKFMSAKQEIIQLFNQETYNANRRKGKSKRKTHSGKEQHKGYQVLKNNHRNSFDEVTPRNLLIVANAMMYNVTELDRQTFYQQFYVAVRKHMPDFIDLLPEL